jgi:hypothetical protein
MFDKSLNLLAIARISAVPATGEASDPLRTTV